MLKSLLSQGFLPGELPPLFSSARMQAIVGQPLPTNFTQTKAPWTQSVQHSLTRPGGLRRKLAIPNPVSFYRLSAAFVNHAPLLQAEWTKSPFSKTSPNGTGPRAFANASGERASSRIAARVGARYLLKADIAQFYPSIYTHSVPWALHTKATAKASTRVATLPGNILDRELQGCHYGQTKGIAIGPDTSLGIAELILSSIDLKIKDTCNPLGGTRFIDDMEFTFRKLADADAALVRLESLLAEFELQLNSAKTRILELPDQIESSHVTALRAHVPAAAGAPPTQWIDFFNRALVQAREHPTETVLRYAVSSLQSAIATDKAWGIAQNLLWQCVAADPGCLRFVLDVLLINRASGNKINLAIAAVALNSLIQTSCPVGHGSEIVWSIWVALILKVPVSPESQAAIAEVDDCSVACAAMVARERKLFPATFASPLWSGWITEGSFVEDHWLFSYEALKRGWCVPEVGKAKLANDLDAAFLVGRDVDFIADDMIDAYVPARLIALAASDPYGLY